MRVSNIKIIEDDIDTISCSGDGISGGHPQIFLKVNSEDYYYSNAIARASKTMFECKSAKTNLKLTGTEG